MTISVTLTNPRHIAAANAAYALTILTIGITVFTRWHPLYLIGLGAILGALGLI